MLFKMIWHPDNHLEIYQISILKLYETKTKTKLCLLLQP